MQIPVLIEPVAGNGFRATGGEPFALTGEGATPEEALGKLKQSLQGRLDAGARIVSVQVPSSDHPWLPFAGMFHEDDPLVQQWREIMAEAREADDSPQVS
jgi:predicted RNase H-like HicB family nuclease